MDAELERWKAAGQYFDYLGFDIFYRRRRPPRGPNLLLDPRLPVQLLGLVADLADADSSGSPSSRRT